FVVPVRPTAPPICTLSLHDALPILFERHLGDPPGFIDAVMLQQQFHSQVCGTALGMNLDEPCFKGEFAFAMLKGSQNVDANTLQDRKSTRLNSSHVSISYAVFCLTK